MKNSETKYNETKHSKQNTHTTHYYKIAICHEHGTHTQAQPLITKLYKTPRPNYCNRYNSNTHRYSQGLLFVSFVVPLAPCGSALRPLATFGRCFLLRSDPPNPRFAKKQHGTLTALHSPLLVPVTAYAVAFARSCVWFLCIIHSWLGLGVPEWQCLPFFAFLPLWQCVSVAVRSTGRAKPKA